MDPMTLIIVPPNNLKITRLVLLHNLKAVNRQCTHIFLWTACVPSVRHLTARAAL